MSTTATNANTTMPTILLQAVQLLVEQEERLQQIQDEQSRQKKQLDAIAQHQEGVGDDTEYMTALAFCRREGESAMLIFAHWLGILANDLCREIHARTVRVPDERWGTVNSYPVEVLRDCLAAINDQNA